VAISIGTVAVNDCAGVALGQLLERADQALYLSKERGRNRLTRSSMGQ
jgi:PleD family two-component response regulator